MKSSSDDESKKLSIFLGRWKIIGQDHRTVANEIKIEGEEVYEWLPGAPLLVNNWSKNIGDLSRKGSGIIGKNFSHHAFSGDKDEYGIYTRTYHIESKNGTWTFSGDKERVSIQFSEDGSAFFQKWESTSDGINWTAMWDINGTKVKPV